MINAEKRMDNVNKVPVAVPATAAAPTPLLAVAAATVTAAAREFAVGERVSTYNILVCGGNPVVVKGIIPSSQGCNESPNYRHYAI